MRHDLLEKDLDEILAATAPLWEELRGQRVFVTGGTGFFGTWILESFSHANKKLKLGASLVSLSRNPENFKFELSHLWEDPSIIFLKGDVKNFEFPTGEFSHILHLVAPAAMETFNNQDPLLRYDTIVEGARRVLEFAVHCKAKKLLFTSSAVVYGKQPEELKNVPEDYDGAPDPTDFSSYASSLGISKRTSEFMCAYFAKTFGIEVKIARCFTFVGPGLPLDVHYAIGNFINDGLNGRTIQIKGDGTTRRSYMYVTDLMIWLWTILFKGQPARPYNVGSEKDVSVGELAQEISRSFGGKIDIRIAKSPTPGQLTNKQVPSTQRAQKELGLKQTVSLPEAIERTIKYHRALGE